MKYQGTRNQSVWNIAESTIRMVLKHYCLFDNELMLDEIDKTDQLTQNCQNNEYDKVNKNNLNQSKIFNKIEFNKIDNLKRNALSELIENAVLNQINESQQNWKQNQFQNQFKFELNGLNPSNTIASQQLQQQQQVYIYICTYLISYYTLFFYCLYIK